MRIDAAIDDVASAEGELASKLLEVGERHRVDHDVFHMSHTLTKKSRESLKALQPIAEKYGTQVHTNGDRPAARVVTAVREKGSELVGRRPAGALLLIHDLREVHLLAARASINWVILAQGAQAIRDEDLLEIVTARHPFALKTLKWSTTRIKQAAPQVLAG